MIPRGIRLANGLVAPPPPARPAGGPTPPHTRLWYVESDAKTSRHHLRNGIQSTDLRFEFDEHQTEISCETIGQVLGIILWC